MCQTPMDDILGGPSLAITSLALPENPSIDELWRQFEIWKAAAEQHDCVDQIKGMGTHWRNPVLNELLPSLLLIRLHSILDLALKHLVEERALSGDSRPKCDSLSARINWAIERIPRLKDLMLHDGRDHRNEIGHEPTGSATWPQLNERMRLVHQALEATSGLGGRRKYDVRCERTALRNSEDPEVMGERDYLFCILEDGAEIIEIKHSERIYHAGRQKQ